MVKIKKILFNKINSTKQVLDNLFVFEFIKLF